MPSAFFLLVELLEGGDTLNKGRVRPRGPSFRPSDGMVGQIGKQIHRYILSKWLLEVQKLYLGK